MVDVKVLISHLEDLTTMEGQRDWGMDGCKKLAQGAIFRLSRLSAINKIYRNTLEEIHRTHEGSDLCAAWETAKKGMKLADEMGGRGNR